MGTALAGVADLQPTGGRRPQLPRLEELLDAASQSLHRGVLHLCKFLATKFAYWDMRFE